MFKNRIYIIFVILFIFHLTIINISPSYAGENPAIDCTQCHTCDHPTSASPCLKPCPRNLLSSTPTQILEPEVVILNELEELYVPVRFNHKLHASMSSMSGSCERCHHYQPEKTEKPSSCKSCHPRDILHENLAKPGLKGAYHRQCLGCHVQWDRETACEVCHEKKAGGKLHGTATTAAIHSRRQPIQLKELIAFKTKYATDDVVPFDHKIHATKYEKNCSVCHKKEGCDACHTLGEESHPMGNRGPSDLHDACFQCHGEANCDHCHGRDQKKIFNHASTGWPLKTYHAAMECRSCHAQKGAYFKLNPECKNCHPQGWNEETFKHEVTGVNLDETHRTAGCKDCHTQGIPSQASCDGCHDDKRTYDPQQGFTKKS